MLSKLPPRERQIVDILYQAGPLTSGDVGERLPDQISGSAIRAMLKRLEDKGFVERVDLDRGYLYSPASRNGSTQVGAERNRPGFFRRIGRRSPQAPCLGMSDKLSADELEGLEAMIAKARNAKGAK